MQQHAYADHSIQKFTTRQLLQASEWLHTSSTPFLSVPQHLYIQNPPSEACIPQQTEHATLH
jgi:hypothetical protein